MSTNKFKAEGNCSVKRNDVDDEQKSSILQDLKEIGKQKHKKYCKANGIKTSSDEESEDEEIVNKEIKIITDASNSPLTKKTLSKKLPPVLEKKKQSRLCVEQSLTECRSSKQEEYHNKVGNPKAVFKRCPPNCKDCLKFKKPEKEENIFVEKRLCKEMQKIKDSKALISKSIQERAELLRKAEKNPMLGSTYTNHYGRKR